MLKIEAITKNFKIFWSLQVRTCVYAYRTLRACKETSTPATSTCSRSTADIWRSHFKWSPPSQLFFLNNTLAWRCGRETFQYAFGVLNVASRLRKPNCHPTNVVTCIASLAKTFASWPWPEFMGAISMVMKTKDTDPTRVCWHSLPSSDCGTFQPLTAVPCLVTSRQWKYKCSKVREQLVGLFGWLSLQRPWTVG